VRIQNEANAELTINLSSTAINPESRELMENCPLSFRTMEIDSWAPHGTSSSSARYPVRSTVPIGTMSTK
jgi:hypothetical protein